MLAGPILTLEGRKLVLRYDSDIEPKAWAEVVFDDVLDFHYRDFSASTPDDVMGHDYFVEEDDSHLLMELRRRRASYVISTAFEDQKDAKSPLKHYRLYFDDVAVVEVVARSAEPRLVEG